MRPSFHLPTTTVERGESVRETEIAAGAHDREERLDAVDAVPEQIGVMAFDRHRALGFAAEEFAELVFVAAALAAAWISLPKRSEEEV